MPPVHTPSPQSVATVQCLLSLQGGQVPPQSMSVSVPFFTPSMQTGAAQKPPAQTWLAQSPLPPQCEPSTHGVASQSSVLLPSQSKEPALQLTTVHVPVAHDETEFGRLQATPQAPQLALV